MKDVTPTKALESEKMFLSSKEARFIYDMREKAKRDLFSSIATAEERGKAIGIAESKAEGILEGIEKTAINLMQMGIDMDKIQKATGLDLSALENLKAKSNF